MNKKLLFTFNGLAGKNSAVDQFMIFCASDLVFIIFALTVVLLGYLLHKRQIATVLWFVGSLVVTYVLLQVAASLYVDHRPFVDHHLTQLVAHAAGKSFPSDHTTVTAAIAAALLFLTPFKRIGIAVAICAFLIGFARIFVGIHYPVDILGGLVVGTVGGAVTFGIKKLVDSRKTERTKI